MSPGSNIHESLSPRPVVGRVRALPRRMDVDEPVDVWDLVRSGPGLFRPLLSQSAASLVAVLVGAEEGADEVGFLGLLLLQVAARGGRRGLLLLLLLWLLFSLSL